MVQNILDYLEATAADCPDKPAFEDLEHSYTFAQVLGNAKRIGSALLQVLPQNAPVPVLMEKEAWTLNVFMGAVCAGCFYTWLNRSNRMSGSVRSWIRWRQRLSLPAESWQRELLPLDLQVKCFWQKSWWRLWLIKRHLPVAERWPVI